VDAAADLRLPMTEIRSTCCDCGVGCGVIISSEDGRVTGVRGDPEHPANFGRLCSKGASLHLSTNLAARALYPELRSGRNETRRRASWDEALDLAATRFAECIAQHGPDSVAFYISGQLLTEDYYVFNKLTKGLIGTNNVDTNSRLCMSSAVAGYKLSLGADAPPCCYDDIACADVIFIAGSNTAFAHPIVFRRIEDAREANPGLKLIVVDPRRTVTAQAATLHLPIRPGTDVMLFNAMLYVMLRDNLVDREYIAAHTEGFADLEVLIADCTPAHAAQVCDVPLEDIVKAARWFAGARAALSLYCQGLNQSASGTYKNSALINLHLATAQIGRPGAGPFSLTGQPNAMGGREVGGMANLLSAHRDLGNPEHRAEVARLWGVPAVPERPGKTAVEMFDAIASGDIRMVWIACTNPAQSMPDAGAVRRALQHAELVVVQDACRDTDTVDYADILLPATTWAEKEGTVTNSERRITRVRAAVPPPGSARHDWEIAVDFAHRLGARLAGANAGRLFPYRSAEEVFDEHRRTTAGRDLDISGLSYAMLETQGPQQWPLPQDADKGRARLYADGRFPTPSGRARFVRTDYAAPAETPDADYPLRLTTGRLRDQWHSMTRTGIVPRLLAHSPEPEASLHPDDMAAHGLADGDLARIVSRRGSLVLKARASSEMRRGDVFIPMHWGSRQMSGAGVNALTLPVFDALSKQPELKHAAARMERCDASRRSVLMRAFAKSDADAGGRLLQCMQEITPLLQRCEYAALAPAEGAAAMLLTLELAAPDDAAAGQLDAAFGLTDDGTLMRYEDTAMNVEKRARIVDGRLVALRLSGETAAAARLKQLMLSAGDVAGFGLQLLAPVATLGAPQADRGRTVCSCVGVPELDIRAAIRGGTSLAELQATLKCGTQCGSCVPELRRMLDETPRIEARAA
jgi:assimilatory nitrate reductase catalytic subunit